MKTIKTIAIVVGILVVLIIIAIIVIDKFHKKLSSESITNEMPYSTVMGTTVTTQQICYIAKNRKASVNKNPYVIHMTNRAFDAEVKDIITLPLGTELSIEDARSFVSLFSSLQRKYILGKVYVEELKKTVNFEMYWNPSAAGYDQEFVGSRNDLMPWHNEILSRKYYNEGIIDSSFYPAQIKDPVVAARFRNTTHYTPTVWKNELMADYTLEKTVYEEDWRMGYISDRQFSVRVLIPKNEVSAFQLDAVFPELNSSLDKVVFGAELTLSPAYYTLIALRFKGQPNNSSEGYSYYNKEKFLGIESALINYDLNGKKIDHILLSSQSLPDSTGVKKATIIKTRIEIEELKNDSTLIRSYQIGELGVINLEEL